MNFSKDERHDRRNAAQMSISTKIDGPWEDMLACLADLDEKDEEIDRLKQQLVTQYQSEIDDVD